MFYHSIHRIINPSYIVDTVDTVVDTVDTVVDTVDTVVDTVDTVRCAVYVQRVDSHSNTMDHPSTFTFPLWELPLVVCLNHRRRDEREREKQRGRREEGEGGGTNPIRKQSPTSRHNGTRGK
jgi:hypothetical protein